MWLIHTLKQVYVFVILENYAAVGTHMIRLLVCIGLGAFLLLFVFPRLPARVPVLLAARCGPRGSMQLPAWGTAGDAFLLALPL